MAAAATGRRRVSLSFGQACGLWELIDHMGGGPVHVTALVRAIGWRNPWREATTIRALNRKGLITVEARSVSATAKGRAALAAWKGEVKG